MATSENALPKLIRDYLTQQGFDYTRVKTTPNFTYDISRVWTIPANQEYTTEQATEDAKAYEVALQAAFQGFEIASFKTINVQFDEMTPPEGEDIRQLRFIARMKAMNYEAPTPVYKEKVAKVKKVRAVPEDEDGTSPRILIGGELTGGSASGSKSKSSKKAGGKKGIIQSPAVTESIDDPVDEAGALVEA